MTIHKVPPDEYTIASVVDAFAKAGRTNEMLHWFQTLDVKNKSPHVYTTLVSTFAKENNLNMVKAVLHDMDRNNVYQDTPFCNALLSAYLRYPNEMKLIYDRMQLYHIPPDKDTFHTLLRGYANAENAKEKISEVLQTMEKHGVSRSAKTINLALTSLFKSGNHQEGFQFYENSKLNVKPDKFILSTIAINAYKHGKSNYMDECVQRVLREPWDYDNVLPAFLLPYLVQNQRWKELLDIVKILEGKGIQYSAIRNFRDRIPLQKIPESLRKDFDTISQLILVSSSNHRDLVSHDLSKKFFEFLKKLASL